LHQIVKARIISVMDPIKMPEDFYEQTPEGNVLATEAVMNTIRTADLLFDRIGQLLRPLGVSGAGGLVLGLLRDHGPMSPSALGEKLIVTRATVTGLLDSLERRGLVQRTPHPNDRRSLVVEITEEGLRILAEVRSRVHRQEKAWLQNLPDSDLRKLIKLLQQVQSGLAATDQ
jgi:DNA-binding MarR family transcriptional regulator